MKQITKKQLLELLTNIKGATPVSILTSTTPKIRKTNNPYYGKVTKETFANVFINFNYQNSVNNLRVKEGNEPDFVPHPRVWGTRIDGTPLVQHGDKFYLECRYLNSSKSVYFYNGNMIDKSQLSEFLPNEYDNSEHQGVSNEIKIKDYNVENILEIKMMGEHYKIVV